MTLWISQLSFRTDCLNLKKECVKSCATLLFCCLFLIVVLYVTFIAHCLLSTRSEKLPFVAVGREAPILWPYDWTALRIQMNLCDSLDAWHPPGPTHTWYGCTKRQIMLKAACERCDIIHFLAQTYMDLLCEQSHLLKDKNTQLPMCP